MADAKELVVNGQHMPVKDEIARTKADASLELSTYLRSRSIDQFGGRNLASQFAEEILEYENTWHWLQARTQSGNFAGLMIGDYIDIVLSSGHEMRYRIAAFDPYYKCADQAHGHHVAMVPDEVVPVTGSLAVNGDHIHWNSNGKNQGTAANKFPYLVSTLHQWETDVFYPMLPINVRERIKKHRGLLEERYSTAGDQTKATGWNWTDIGYVWSLSEVEVYGSVVWGTIPYSYGFDCQFPLFSLTKDRIRYLGGSRATWWLRSPSGASAAHACIVNGSGDAGTNSVTGTYCYPLPCFLIG